MLMKGKIKTALNYLAIYCVLFFIVPLLGRIPDFFFGKLLVYAMLFVGNLPIIYFLSRRWAKRYGFAWFIPLMPALFWISVPLFHPSFFIQYGTCYIFAALIGDLYDNDDTNSIRVIK